MRFDYFDMLSGQPIMLHGVGHIKSPKLCDICPNTGTGYKVYNFYLNLLSWNKEQLLKYDEIMQIRGTQKLYNDILNVFDVATLLQRTRELYRVALSFFIVENIEWDEANRRFAIYETQETESQQRVLIGQIDRNNFEDVRLVLLQFNFIGLDEDGTPIKHSSKKSKELWDRAQKYLSEQASSSSNKENPAYHLSNIVSKLCAVHPSYNLLNVFNLTIFQLYDAFFQVGYLRSTDLNERIYSNHGGEDFKFENWLKPILDNM